MREFVVASSEEGRRLDRYIQLLLPNVPRNYLYKSLRGNGVRVNGKREHNKDRVLTAGDRIAVYYTDEQFVQFGFKAMTSSEAHIDIPDLQIAYEDDNLVVFNKPAGMLSQKADGSELSLTEFGREYLYQNGLEHTAAFRPGVCNRLDRNTSGLMIMGKNLSAAQAINAMIKDRRIKKYYAAIVHGHLSFSEDTLIHHFFYKDRVKNRLIVSDRSEKGQQDEVSCLVRTLAYAEGMTLVHIELLTGKSHQIRAQLSYLGHPIVGDPKYQSPELNTKYDALTDRQLLHACELVFETPEHPLESMTGVHIRGDIPQDFQKAIMTYFNGNNEVIYS